MPSSKSAFSLPLIKGFFATTYPRAFLLNALASAVIALCPSRCGAPWTSLASKRTADGS